jgi:hypothetical protein
MRNSDNFSPPARTVPIRMEGTRAGPAECPLLGREFFCIRFGLEIG